ncbi:hypothetical protein TELCIR_13514, partial [Teladorsagia circumcincta]
VVFLGAKEAEEVQVANIVITITARVNVPKVDGQIFTVREMLVSGNVTAPPPAIPCKIKDEVELLRAGLRNKHGDHVTAASVYLAEMTAFFIALFLYHHFYFMPRVRLKMYKISKEFKYLGSLIESDDIEVTDITLRISSLDLIDEKTEDRREDVTQRGDLNDDSSPFSKEMEMDADVENRHFHSPRRKRPHHNADSHISRKVKRPTAAVHEASQGFSRGFLEVAGRVAGVELENFMCHGRLKVDFDTANNNCFYIGGPNGSGKSALFASLNIGLGGRGNDNDRGPSVKTYIKEGKNKAKIRLILTNRGLGCHPDYGDFVVVERTITPSSSTYTLKSITGSGRNQHDYMIFMHATELEHTKECYEKCEQIVTSIGAMCRSMKSDFEKQKR